MIWRSWHQYSCVCENYTWAASITCAKTIVFGYFCKLIWVNIIRFPQITIAKELATAFICMQSKRGLYCTEQCLTRSMCLFSNNRGVVCRANVNEISWSCYLSFGVNGIKRGFSPSSSNITHRLQCARHLLVF